MNHKIFNILIIMIFLNCAFFFRTHPEPTPQEKALDQIWYISTPEQRNTLKALEGNVEIMEFMYDFWKQLDPTPGTPENEFKDEYLKRCDYVQKYYPNRWGRGRSDKGRVYLLYGPPDDILYYPIYDEYLTKFERLTSLEIWIYDRPKSNIKTPNMFSNIFPYHTKFVFGDLYGDGLEKQIYSTVKGEWIDPRVYRDFH